MMRYGQEKRIRGFSLEDKAMRGFRCYDGIKFESRMIDGNRLIC